MSMRVAMIGMGYVGAVTSAALAQRGVHVTGVECSPIKLHQLKQGQSPVREPGLSQAMAAAHQAGLFTATDDLTDAVRLADIVMIAVGTPSDASGKVNLEAVLRVVDELAAALTTHPRQRVVMVRSTVPPGTTQNHIAPRLKAACDQTAVCHHPEFLREGSALADWANPAMIVHGCNDTDQPAVAAMIERLYVNVEAPRIALASAESELMKYACNVFHAVKIDFANEIGSLAAACGADPARVMAAFAQDRRLNISPAYLKPGFAFGGSCLPKDTRALSSLAREHQLDLPLIDSVLASNDSHLTRQVKRVLAHGRQNTLLLGLTFKTGTDDLRESPMVELAERLLGKGIVLSIHDGDLNPRELVGANARYIQDHLPHLKMLLRDDLAQAIDEAATVIIAKPTPGLEASMLAGKNVVDLTGQFEFAPSERDRRIEPKTTQGASSSTAMAA